MEVDALDYGIATKKALPFRDPFGLEVCDRVCGTHRQIQISILRTPQLAQLLRSKKGFLAAMSLA